MVVQIKSGKRENGTSFWDNLYRKRSTNTPDSGQVMNDDLSNVGPINQQFYIYVFIYIYI